MAVKNQNDLIVSVTAGVLALGTAAAFYFTKPEPETKPNPASVVVNAAEIKAASVVYTNRRWCRPGWRWSSSPASGNQRHVGRLIFI
jgi:hypothetical protein